jgi:transposase
MRTGISITVSPSDHRRLEALIRDRNAAQKHVWRAEIVLLSTAGVGTVEIMRRTGKSKTCVWRWQERFAEEGVDGLLRDKTRPSRIAPLEPEVAERVVALTLADPPVEATHWTAAMMAEGFFAKLTRRRLKRGTFHSLVDLQAATNRFVAEQNAAPKPFIWRGHQALDSIH